MSDNQLRHTFTNPEWGEEGAGDAVEEVAQDTEKPTQPDEVKDRVKDDEAPPKSWNDEEHGHEDFKSHDYAQHTGESSQPRTSNSHSPDNVKDDIEKAPTQEDNRPSIGVGTNLSFAETTKNHITRKLHLHRGTAKGPSEARQRRQSSVALPPEDDIHLPWYIHLRNALFGSLNMFTSFPYWDMAFWSGWSYTWGSVLFVMDGAWAWTPQRWPDSEFPGEAKYGVGLLFFFGALLYELGATMAYLEAINDGCFSGSALKRHLEGHDDDAKQLLDAKLHLFFGHMIPHHHRHDDEEDHLEKQRTWDAEAQRRTAVDMGDDEKDKFHEYLTWRWWPTWKCFKEYHIKDVGYVACSIQLFGATLYGICGVISLPGILDTFTDGQEIGGYWVPQTVASCCFLTAGILFTYETQPRWNTPLPRRIAWWIGVWATIGSIGFL